MKWLILGVIITGAGIVVTRVLAARNKAGRKITDPNILKRIKNAPTVQIVK